MTWIRTYSQPFAWSLRGLELRVGWRRLPFPSLYLLCPRLSLVPQQWPLHAAQLSGASLRNMAWVTCLWKLFLRSFVPYFSYLRNGKKSIGWTPSLSTHLSE